MNRAARPAALPAVLALAILGISVSGPLARAAQAPPLTIAVWRLLLSMGFVGVALLASETWREWRALSRRDVAVALGAGFFLALHFWSWIASLGMTSVAASVLLVNLHPLVIVTGSALWLGERPTRAQVVGLAIALLGAVVVGVGDLAVGELATGASVGDTAAGDLASESVAAVGDGATASRRALLGNGLAVIGAVTVGLYYLAGRSLRQRLSLWPYVGLVYGACLVVLLVLALAQGAALWPVAPRELGIFALIALGPMLAGHTGFNWALRYVPAYVVSLALLAEPLGAGAVAWLALGERPSAATMLGGAVVLAGLALSVAAERRR